MLTLTNLSLELFGWLSGFWVQTVPGASRNHAIVDRHTGEATVRKGVSAGCVSSLLHITWLSPFIWGKITQNPQSGYPKGAQLNGSARFYVALATTERWPRLACWPQSRLAGASGDQSLPSFSRVTGGGGKRLPTSVNFKFELTIRVWCGRQRMELPNLHESVFYQRFRVNQ